MVDLNELLVEFMSFMFAFRDHHPSQILGKRQSRRRRD